MLWKHQLEVELVPARFESSIRTQHLFILKQRGIAVAEEPELRNSVRNQLGRDEGFVGGVWVLVDAYETTQRDSQVGDPDGLDDGEDDSSFDGIAGVVFAMWFGGADVEIDQVARTPRSDGQGESGEEGAGGGLVLEGGRGVAVAGECNHLCEGDDARRLATGWPRRPRAVSYGSVSVASTLVGCGRRGLG